MTAIEVGTPPNSALHRTAPAAPVPPLSLEMFRRPPYRNHLARSIADRQRLK